VANPQAFTQRDHPELRARQLNNLAVRVTHLEASEVDVSAIAAIATGAATDAASAAAAAAAAEADATSALSQLTHMGDDTKLTPVEKRAAILDYTALTGEHADIDAKATAYAITTEKTNYDNALAALAVYLASLNTPVAWNDRSNFTTMVGATWNSKWVDVYETRQLLLNKIADIAGSNAAPGDANRARFSQMEKGSIGYAVYDVPASGGSVSAISTGQSGGKYYAHVSGTFTALNTVAGYGTAGANLVGNPFLIPCVAGERLFLSATIGSITPGPGFGHVVRVYWYNSAGTTLSSDDIYNVSPGTSGISFPTRVGNFFTAPAGTVAAVIVYYLFNGVAGTGSFDMFLSEVMACGAAPNQTVWPAFHPGPSGEFGADVTALIDLPASVTIYADSSGTPKSGELPKPVVGRYLRAGTALSSGLTWSATTTEGNVTFTISGSGAADLEITGPNNSTLALESKIELTGTYQGTIRKASITVLRSDDPPTSSGGSGGGGGSGSSGSTTTLGDTTGTSYDLTNAISSPEMFVAAGAGGNLVCAAPLNFKRTGVTLGAGPDGATGAAGKWQYRTVGGTWTDVTGGEAASSQDSVTDVDPDTGKHRTSGGTLSVPRTQAGLTPGTTYGVRFAWRRLDVSGTAKNVTAVGTLTVSGT
jgi:hypothetical protein